MFAALLRRGGRALPALAVKLPPPALTCHTMLAKHAILCLALLPPPPAVSLHTSPPLALPPPAPRRAPPPRLAEPPRGIRVNKALRATHSRRAADQLVAAGRVCINGLPAPPGARLCPGDTVTLDGAHVAWERLNGEPAAAPFVYLKMWKPRGVICTTDARKHGNVIAALGTLPGVRDRIFPVGRLDVDSSGLLLLTSDGSIVNALLRASERKSKEYVVTTSPRATDRQLQRMARGVVLTTLAQRDGKAKARTARTRPCVVERIETGYDPARLRFVLQEGRNRQIRRMCEACGLSVLKLHRVGFAGITLQGCRRPGDWAFLTDEEVAICRRAAEAAAADRDDAGEESDEWRE